MISKKKCPRKRGSRTFIGLSRVWDVLSGVAEVAWDVLSGAAKMAWDVLSGVTKTAWDVLSGVAN